LGPHCDLTAHKRLIEIILEAVRDLQGAGAKYLVQRKIGAGGMGVVHLGTMVTPAGERRVAIKQLHSQAGEVEEANERIIAEAKLVFQLTHANVCQVLDLAVSEVGTFLIMEFVDGCDLKTLIKRGRNQQLEVAAAVHIGSKVAQGLDYAHRRKDAAGRSLLLVHGDVTPQNVLLSREGEVKLADFGIARSLGRAEAGATHVIAGTPGFIAPETLAGTADQRADIYALGVTLYCALGGPVPAQGERLNLRTLVEKRPEIAPELIAILERAVAPHGEGYAQAAEMARALAEYQALRFPQFTEASLGEIVEGDSVAPLLEDDAGASLMSLTGTATFLAPVVFTGEVEGSASAVSAGPRGTRKVQKSASAPPPLTKRTIGAWPWVGGGLGLLACVGLFALSRAHHANDAALPAPILAKAESVRAPTTAMIPTAPLELSAPAGLRAPAEPPAPAKRSRPSAVKAPRPHAATTSRALVAVSRAENVTPAQTSYLSITSTPWGAVYVDGRQFADATPVYKAQVASGTHRVSVYSPQRKARSPEREVTIRPGETRVLGFVW
jgi:serine/threonine-protein kinase